MNKNLIRHGAGEADQHQRRGGEGQPRRHRQTPGIRRPIAQRLNDAILQGRRSVALRRTSSSVSRPSHGCWQERRRTRCIHSGAVRGGRARPIPGRRSGRRRGFPGSRRGRTFEYLLGRCSLACAASWFSTWFAQLRRQSLLQQLQTAMEQSAQRAVRHTHLHLNGFVIGAGEVAQRQRQAIFFRQ